MSQPIDTAYVLILPDFSKFESALRRDLTLAMARLKQQVKSAFDDIEDGARHAGISIAVDITIGAKVAERAMKDLGDSSDRDLKRVSKSAANVGKDLQAGAFSQALSFLGGQIADLAGSFSPTSLVFPLIITALIPVVIALASALAELIGFLALLPAGIAVLVAAVAPLVIAFQNFGEAVSAIASGDVQKIDEALKKLAPTARNVAKEFAAILPQLKGLQLAVQGAFFGPLQGVLSEIAANILPALTRGLSIVAGALGNVFAQVGHFFALAQNVSFLNDLFATTARIVNAFGPTLVRFFAGFEAAAHALLPTFERLTLAVFRIADGFSSWLTEAARTGQLQAFVDGAIKTFKELGDLVSAVGGLIKTLFAGTNQEGHDFIQTLTDVVTRLNDFFKSDDGQRFLTDFVAVARATGATIGFLVNAFIWLGQAIQNTKDFFNELHDKVASGKGELRQTGEDIKNFFAGIGDFISGIPGKVGEFLSSLPGVIADAFVTAFDQALTAVGIGIGLILFAVTELPRQILGFLQNLPQQIVDILSKIGPFLTDLFHQITDSVKGETVGGFDQVIEFIKSIPSRIIELGKTFLEAGVHIIRQFIDGFRNVGPFIGNVAGDIVNAIKGFINHVIDKINIGIAQVDDALPGSLPRIPRLAKGGIIPATPGGQLVVAGEGGQAEAIVPLSTLKNMTSGGPSIVFGEGSIVVSFEGVVPSATEARNTGSAIADGISAQLIKRDIRMLARAA